MSPRYRSVKGMNDLLPPATGRWAAVEAQARRTFAAYGYDEIRTPIVEPTELFVRSIGATTDIVGKEMYSFDDRKGRSLTLRPESTAAVVRAFLQGGLHEGALPARLYYMGPHFRYERPQRGRYRQFHQIGAELIGVAGPAADVEVVLMLVRFLRDLGFGGLVVNLNTVGDTGSRAAYIDALRGYLEPHKARLGDDSRRRFDDNPLRILDSKDPAERALITEAPRLADHLNETSRRHFETVLELLAELRVEHRVEPRLVRGLDYYAHTVFEIVAAGLGAQDAIVGGGRYDGLVRELGGPDLPGIGFAIGEDRLVEVLPEAGIGVPAPAVVLLPVGDVPERSLLGVAERLRDGGVAVTPEPGRASLKAGLKRAHRAGARWVVLLGEDELEAGEVTVRDLADGAQERLTLNAAAVRLKGTP